MFDAYRSRSSAGSLLGTKKHPIQKLEEFFLNLNSDLLTQRSRLVAEHNLHFATLAWVNDPSKRLHLASMHILCELCAFHDREKWSEEVCKSIVELGGVSCSLPRASSTIGNNICACTYTYRCRVCDLLNIYT